MAFPCTSVLFNPWRGRARPCAFSPRLLRHARPLYLRALTQTLVVHRLPILIILLHLPH